MREVPQTSDDSIFTRRAPVIMLFIQLYARKKYLHSIFNDDICRGVSQQPAESASKL